ncbi:Strictosidine synthase [Morella rubra]|uniref:Strictosidine synthase n=1 Tax=Morella rubra TaxID=262757 RepID=A0A6A1V1G1_9ROSI|nr:Strictosidine synthase [Morella rubra]
MKLPFPSSALFFVLFSVTSSLILSYETNSIDHLRNYRQLDLPTGAVGPESIAFDCHGNGPYVGVSDGRILKWRGKRLGWAKNRHLCDGSTNPNSTHEQVCGRPLGLKFNPATCDLYIADAYFGLLMVGSQGGEAKQLATSAGGVPFRFTNGLDVDNKFGVVYFTDSSILFQRRSWLRIILEGDRTGRLMKYDPRTKKVTVLLKGLAFANGVALSNDSSFLLLSETGAYQVVRFWLRGPKRHTSEVFCQVERAPDNIKRNIDGQFWVALNSGREIPIPDYNLDDLNHEIAIPRSTKDVVAAKLDEEGKVVSILDGKGGNALDSVSEVVEHNGILWIGSAVKPYVGVAKTLD